MDIRMSVFEILNEVENEAAARSFKASNELRNAALIVLRGNRSGRRYRVPYTGAGQTVTASGKVKRRKPKYYTASAPGEAPANRTGTYRLSYRPIPKVVKQSGKFAVYAAIGSNYRVNGKLLGQRLEEMNRPHREAIIRKAYPTIKRIYSEPYIRR